MAKRDTRMYGVSVVGLSGTGGTGVGKSCFCNRFMRPTQDEYQTNHISLLSQSDFGGRVVNNDHFLYWGEVTRLAEDGTEHVFHVIEQTEFIDDSSFQPFKCGKTDQYAKRCAAVKIQSAEKLMYICKDQLGVELEYEQKMLPDGRLSVDGYLCLFDVSKVPQRHVERQTEIIIHILQQLVKTKKPIVLVTTKNDELHEPNAKEIDKILARKDLKASNILVVESSAQENVNVDQAFLILAQLMDKTVKKLPKVISYVDSARALTERKEMALEAYRARIRMLVTDYKSTWTVVCRKLKQYPDTQYFIDLSGSAEAKQVFQRHVKYLRDECVRQKQAVYVETLQTLLAHVLPDLASTQDRSWPSMQRWLQSQEFFNDHFVRIADGLPWQLSDVMESTEERIPFDLLDSSDAESVYRNHINVLRAEHKRNDLKKQFQKCLEENENICPGKSLADVAIFFLGRECFSSLSEEDKSHLYEQHQQKLHARAKFDFQELLFEHAEYLSRLENVNIRPEDVFDLSLLLKTEPRYEALRCMQKEREAILYSHLGFVQAPSKKLCVYNELCVDNKVEHILFTKARRPQSWSRSAEFLLESEDNRLNLVILGSHDLTNALADEIRGQCHEDEYALAGEIFSLDYRLIDGDVQLPHNSFKTKQFAPHGCFCVFHSSESLRFIEQSLEKTLLSSAVERDARTPFQGLPIVIVLAHNPRLSETGLQLLRDDGQSLADKLQCPFVDVPSSMMLDVTRRFHGDQINLAMHSLLQCIKHRSSLFVKPGQIVESLEPDVRLLMCFMCGDAYNLELPLAPLLNHQCCYVNHIDRFPTVTLETYLDDSKRRVEVTVAAYHDTSLVRDELFHGYILVYSAERKASLANLRAFSRLVMPEAPAKIVAVSERGASALFSSEHVQKLLMEGNSWADELNAEGGGERLWSFMTTCQSFHTQTASYTPFFRDCWEHKSTTEAAHSFSDGTALNDFIMDRFAPHRQAHGSFSTFGKAVGGGGGVGHSQNGDLEEPIYDRPHMGHCYSDGEGDQSRSYGMGPRPDTSPYGMGPRPDTSPYAVTNVRDDMYSEIPAHRKNKYGHRSGHSNHTGLLDGSNTTADDKRSPPPTFSKAPSQKSKPGQLDGSRYGDVRDVLSRNLQDSRADNTRSFRVPMASPEEEINIGDYAQVKDALIALENEYAEVVDALPDGRVLRIRPSHKSASVKGPDSTTDSEFSSLERDRHTPQETIYSKVNRKPTPHKKKAKTRNPESSLPPPPPPPQVHRGGVGDKWVAPMHGSVERLRSNSPSEGSEGTGDEVLKKPKKRRSFKRKSRDKEETPLIGQRKSRDKEETPLIGSVIPVESDPDSANVSFNKGFVEDETCDVTSPKGEVESDEFLDSGLWKNLLSNLIPDKTQDAEKQRRKDEKKKLKEEEKKQKEQQKAQKKAAALNKKKDPKSSLNTSGLVLEDLVTDEMLIPAFVTLCVAHIEQEGLSAEGIYRVNGNRAQVELLFDKFREDECVDISAHDIPVNAVATALKQFFMDLSCPLVPTQFYDELIQVAGISEHSTRLLAVRGVLQKIPQHNLQLLKYLITHIHKISENSAENKMSIDNLAVCWWPTILRPNFDSLESFNMVSKYLEEVIKIIIKQYRFFFYGENEV